MTVPQDGEQHTQVLQRTRKIDMCALIPRDALAQVAPVLEVNNPGPSSCSAALTVSTTMMTSIGLDWGADVSGTPRPGDSPELTYSPDGTTIGTNRQTCLAFGSFPAGASLWLTVQAPQDTEPCAVAKKLLPGAVRRWMAEPPQGSSADTKPSKLLGMDPCEIATRLGAQPSQAPAQPGSLWRCAFRYRDHDVSVAYDYGQEKVMAQDGTVVQTGSRTIYHSNLPLGPADWSYEAAVGPTTGTPTPMAWLGSYVPVVKVVAESDDSGEVGADLMRQTLALFP
ncbi:hypothetical protein ACFXHA_42645 [Nocardia sp. NPDC059240]|uniref:hypothetical protein n=1 Tax=Nocardia sp. NPDC059240 TaxID=3346786 RepID=UPI003694F148